MPAATVRRALRLFADFRAGGCVITKVDEAASLGGHATLFRGHDGSAEVFHPLPSPLMKLHRNLKQAFDPDGILNPGRLYPDI